MGTHNRKQSITLYYYSRSFKTSGLRQISCSAAVQQLKSTSDDPQRGQRRTYPFSRLNTQPFAETTANTYAFHRNVAALTTAPLPWHKYVGRPATTSARSNNRNNIPHTAPVPPAWVADPTRQTTPPLSSPSEQDRGYARHVQRSAQALPAGHRPVP